MRRDVDVGACDCSVCITSITGSAGWGRFHLSLSHDRRMFLRDSLSFLRNALKEFHLPALDLTLILHPSIFIQVPIPIGISASIGGPAGHGQMIVERHRVVVVSIKRIFIGVVLVIMD